MKAKPTTYDATVTAVHDGDTLTAVVEFGATESHLPGIILRTRSTAEVKLRLDGINAPELPTPEGIASRDWLTTRCLNKKFALSIVAHQDKYGRWLGVVFDGQTSINGEMLKLGLAKPFMV